MQNGSQNITTCYAGIFYTLFPMIFLYFHTLEYVYMFEFFIF